MPLAKRSSESMINAYTMLDNMFVTNYMPDADATAIKVYLYGLMQCGNSTRDNSSQSMGMTLGVSKEEIIEALYYWQDMGAVRIISEDPLEYEYIPLKTDRVKVKKYDPNKYSDFVDQVQNSILCRTMTPNETLGYVEVIDDYKIEPEAMIMIISYCQKLKGDKVNSNYIWTVAKVWANDGIRTVSQVEDKLREMECTTDDIRQVYYTLGLKSTPDFEDKQQLIKWTKSWGYTLECVLYVAKLCKKRGGIKKLDSMLDNFYRKGIFTLADIKEQADYIEYVRNLTININKRLGVFYENIEPVIDQYTIPWLDKGYDGKGLITIATYCFRKNIKRLESVDELIENMYKKGIISNEAIDQYFESLARTDKAIKSVLTAIGSSRSVTTSDRDYYNTWVELWGFNSQIIDYATSLSVGKSHSLAYINQLLSNWKNNNCTTLEQCQNYSQNTLKMDSNSKQNSKNTQAFAGQRTYTQEELDNIYGDLEDESRFDF